MDILGSGMIARAFAPYKDEFPDTVVFACGVPGATNINQTAKARELMALYSAILRRCADDGKRLVYFSSGAVYGNGAPMPWNEAALLVPYTEYGQHKLVCETLIRNANIPYLILRLGNLVGENQNRAQLVPSLIKQIRTGNATVHLRATRDLMDVDDMAAILAGLLRTQSDVQEVINVASGFPVPVGVIAYSLRALMGKSAAVIEMTPDVGDQQWFDITHLKDRLPETAFDSAYFIHVLEKYVHADVLEQQS